MLEMFLQCYLFLGLTPPAGCAVWVQIWERACWGQVRFFFFALQTPLVMQIMHPQPPSIICITWSAFFLGIHLGVVLGHVDFSRFPCFLKIHLQNALPHGLRGARCIFSNPFFPKKLNPAGQGHFEGPKSDTDDAGYSFDFPFKRSVPRKEVGGSGSHSP